MSIPVVEIPKHLKSCNEECLGSDTAPKGGCSKCRFYKCDSFCPACAVEANNKAWAKYLDGQSHSAWPYVEVVTIPAADWEQIKKLAEEK